MQFLVEMVDSFTCSIRRIVGMLVLGGIVIAGILTLGVNLAAPVVAEEIGERAESLGEKAIRAAQEEHRAAEAAKDGWGTPEPTRYNRDSDWGTDLH